MSELERNVKASSVMSFAGSVVGAYESGSIDNHPTIYDIYRSAQNHVKDNYGIDTDNWDDSLSKESRHDNHDRLVEEIAQLKADYKKEFNDAEDLRCVIEDLTADKAELVEMLKRQMTGNINLVELKLLPSKDYEKDATKLADDTFALLQKHKG